MASQGWRTIEKTVTEGLGPYELLGADNTFERFRESFADGAVVTVVMCNPGRDEAEEFLATLTYGSPDTLTRIRTSKSSDGGDPIEFSKGSKLVMLALPHHACKAAERLKPAVRAVVTSNVTLASVTAGSTFDSLTMVTGNRFGVLAQTTVAERGLYEVAASGAPTRVLDFSAGDTVSGATFVVLEGTYAGAVVACKNSEGSDVVGTSTLSFQISGPGVWQPLDAELTAIAGLTSAADKGIHFTGSGTAATHDLTSYARTLLDDANASAARTTLALGTIATQDASNVTITGGSITGITDLAVADGGTGASTASAARSNLGAQAAHVNLDGLSSLTSAADKLPYFSNTGGVMSLADLTSYARTLLDDADATTARSTLGLGTIATQASSNVTITGGSITGITDLAVADGGTGASTALNARTNLGIGEADTPRFERIGVGGTAQAGIGLFISNSGSGATQRDIHFQGLVTDATCTQKVSCQGNVRFSGATVNATNGFAFRADDGTLLSSALCANLYGLDIQNQTIGGTSNTGIRIQVSSGAGKLAIDSSGTAASNHAGDLRVGATATNGKATVRSTSKQLALEYDGSNSLDVTVSSAGLVTLDAVGASAGFVFSDGLQAGSGAGRAKLGGTFHSNVTAVGNVGAGEDDLMTKSIDASTLSANKQALYFLMIFEFAANANNKRVRVKYGATTVYDSTAAANNNGQMAVEGWIIRTGATSQIAIVETRVTTGITADRTLTKTAPAETLSGAVTLKATGEATADNDVQQTLMLVQWYPDN